MNDETTIATPADPDDPDDFAITVAAWKRGIMGRSIRQLRNRLGMSQTEFAEAFCVPVVNIRQYEIGRHMPPPAVRAYFKAIAADPKGVRSALLRESAKAFDIADVEAA